MRSGDDGSSSQERDRQGRGGHREDPEPRHQQGTVDLGPDTQYSNIRHSDTQCCD